MKEEIFISCFGILVLFNIFVAMVNPTVSCILSMNLISILVTGLTVAIATGVTVFGSGLSDSATELIFSTIVIMNVLFQVNVFGFTIGMGLATTMATVFNSGDLMGFGTIIAGTISILALFSGIMIINGG